MSAQETPDPRRRVGTLGLIASVPILAALTVIFTLVNIGIAIGVARLSGDPALEPLAKLWQQLGPGVQSRSSPGLAFFIGMLVYVGAICAVVTLARVWGGRGWRVLLALVAWRPRAVRDVALLTLAALVYGVVAGLALGYFAPQTSPWDGLVKGRSVAIASFLLIVVLAPVAEELVFRGWAYTALRARWGFGSALGATSTIFALMHWEKTHLYALAVLPVGCLLGVARERSGSVTASMILHATFNFCGWAALVAGIG